MCWSAEASLNTFLFALFGAAIALFNRVADPRLVLFLMTFSAVQLVEFFAWRRIRDRTGLPIRTVAVLLALVIVIEPVASIALLDGARTRALWWAAYGAFVALAALLAFSGSLGRVPEWTLRVAPNGHLRWDWLLDRSLAVNVLGLAWAAFLIAPLWFSGYRWAFAYALASLALSVVCYWREGTLASMWCWIAALAWVLLVAKAFVPSSCMLPLEKK